MHSAQKCEHKFIRAKVVMPWCFEFGHIPEQLFDPKPIQWGWHCKKCLKYFDEYQREIKSITYNV